MTRYLPTTGGVSVRAGDAGTALTLTMTGVPVTASATSRTLAGPVVRYGEYGRTSAGQLRVRAGALKWPADLTRVKLTREHERGESRGYITAVDDDGTTVRVTAKVGSGPEGDAALSEADEHVRDGFSFDVVDAVIHGDWLEAATVIAIGQVGIPAYDDMRIDSIAASATPNPTERNTMTEDQRARLTELRQQSNLSPAEQTELEALAALESAEQQAPDESGEGDSGAGDGGGDGGGDTSAGDTSAGVSASVPAVPSGGPRRRTSSTTTRRRGYGPGLAAFCAALTRGLRPGQSVTAALSDITNAGADGGILSLPAWSGELWSGLQHEPEFTPLLNSGELTNWQGQGWRWVTKPEMEDYAGNKAAIPSAPVDTEPADYTAARMAVGHDIDRKFFDFPDSGFIESYVAAVRESWSVKLDAKVRAFIETEAVPVTGPDGGDPDTDPDPIVRPTLLRAAAVGARKVKRNTNGAKATFVVASDNDFDTLMDVSEHDVPAFLDLFGIDPGAFTSSPDVADGTVIVGTKQAATVRTLPGSPIRVDAQHIANGGIDQGFFGYWAIEQHHLNGIVSVQFAAA